MHNSIFTFIEILGTISFSVSGVIAGMKRNLDIFGIVHHSGRYRSSVI